MFRLSLTLFVAFLFTFITLVQSSPLKAGGVKGLGVPISNAGAKNIVSNSYIVVYNNNATDASVELHRAQIATALRKRSLSARALDGRKLSSTMRPFSMAGWRGMTLEAEDAMMLDIAAMTDVSGFFPDIE